MNALSGDQTLLILFGIAAWLLQIGFALRSAGASRRSAATAAVFRVSASAAVSTLAFWAVGYAVLTGHGNRWLSVDPKNLFQQPARSTESAVEFFNLAVAAIGGSVVCSAVAERSRFRVGIAAAALFAGLVYPATARWATSGWLTDLGFIDLAGATYVHLSAAVIAAVAVALVGPRSRATAEPPAGHAIPVSMAGSMVLAIAWMPYTAGSVVAHRSAGMDAWVLESAVIDVSLAGAAGLAGGIAYGYSRFRKPDAFFAAAGMIGGLVAISSAVVAVGNIGAVCVGFGAGVVVPIVAGFIDDKTGLDDPAGVIAAHGAGAVWGTLMTAVLAVGLTGPLDHVRLLAIQCLGIAVVIAFVAAVSGIALGLLRLTGPLRVAREREAAGLDRFDHGLVSYPADA